MGVDIDLRIRNMPLSSPFFTAIRRIASEEVDQLGLTSWRRIALAALLPAYGASYLIWYYAGWGGAELHQLLVPLAFVPILLFSIALAFRAARVGNSVATRRAWACIGLGMTAYAAGNLAWLSFGMTAQSIPFPSIADFGFLAFFPIVLVGLGLLPRERPEGMLRSILDMALVMVGAGVVIWWLVLGPVVAATGGQPNSIVLVAIAYPVGDTMVLFALLVALLGRLTETPRTVLVLLAVGLVLNIVADLAYARLSLSADYVSGGWSDIVYLLVWIAMGTAAAIQGTSSQRAVSSPKPASLQPITLLPYLAVVAVYVPLAVSSFTGDGSDRVLVTGAIVATLLVVGRQVYTARQNASLMTQRASARVAARFQALIRNAPDVILVTDSAGLISFATPSVEALVGRGATSVEGTSIADLLAPADAPKVMALLGAAATRPGISGPALVQAAGTAAPWVEIRVSNLLDDSLISGLVATIHDVTERRAFEQQLEAQAFRDPLTGLANRILFAERVERAVVRARRSRRLPSVLYLDMDDFKRINDTFGHAIGDRVLVEVAHRIEQTIRSEDTAARLGSDEFAVLLDETSDTLEAVALAERLEAAFAAPFAAGGSLFSLLSSIGIVRSGQSRSTSAELLRNAEIAMYAAKRESRGGHLVFQPAMYAETVDRVHLEGDLRQAMDRGELKLVYQPIVALPGGDLRGVEALLRWQHPQRGLVMPAEFISLAEGSGEIRRIGAWVLGEACRMVGSWNAKYPATRLTANVNVSVGQLVPEFVAQVAAILADTGFEPGQLVLEITEGVFSDDRNDVVGILDGLRRLGVRISIDDFGTGYSSLSRLRDLPVDELKVDRSFISQLGGDLNRSFVSTILHLAKELSLQTVAEGIEEEEEMRILVELGCELGQGYLIARPAEPAALEEMLATRGLLRPAA
jgi:diguanylate cyclase (GGDEF)-like protein/PAS domain S-box-containing protein